MRCKLCLEETTLIKKSHIIPKFMYNGLFDEKHFMSLVNMETLEIDSKKPDGIYDKYILCAKCDNEIIGKYESYASKLLFGGKLSKKYMPKFHLYKDNRGANKLNIQNLDYNKFKLFFLSILWRGHISNNYFFKEINLGKYAEEIRQMIFFNNAKNENQFETTIFSYHKDFIKAKTLIPARKFRMNNKTICYLIHIQGISMVFKVSKNHIIDIFEEGKIKINGETNIYSLKGSIAESLFKRMTGL